MAELMTSEDFKKMFYGTGSQTISKIIADLINQQNITIDILIDMNDKLVTKLNKFLYTSKKNNQQYITKFFNKTTKTEEELQNLMLASTIYIFEVRRFFLNEEITFLLGSIYKDENKEQKLQEIRISQQDLYQFLKIRDNAIIVDETNKNLKNYIDKNITENISNLWLAILELSSVDEYYKSYKKNNFYIYLDYIFYGKLDPDYNVMFKFGTDKNGKKYINSYYHKNNADFQIFNRGWLFEWFKEYISKDEDNIDNLQNSIKRGSINPIIQKTDSIGTTKGGDYIEKKAINNEVLELQQIQAKYGNPQIIAFDQIKTQLLVLNQSFKKYKELNKDYLPEEILKIFTNPTILQNMANLSNKTIDDITADFKEKIQKNINGN